MSEENKMKKVHANVINLQLHGKFLRERG